MAQLSAKAKEKILLAIHAKYPLHRPVPSTGLTEEMTNEEVEAHVDEWVTANS